MESDDVSVEDRKRARYCRNYRSRTCPLLYGRRLPSRALPPARNPRKRSRRSCRQDRSVRPPFLRLRQLLHCHPGSSGRPTCFQGSHLTASIASMRHQALFRKRLSLGLYSGHRVRTIRPDFLQSSWPPPEKSDLRSKRRQRSPSSMARAARSRDVWTPLLPAISDRNRNKSEISEFVMGLRRTARAVAWITGCTKNSLPTPRYRKAVTRSRREIGAGSSGKSEPARNRVGCCFDFDRASGEVLR